MKTGAFFLAAVILVFSLPSFASDGLLFYRIRLDSEINKASQRLVTVGLEKADEADADYVILDINTYGGAVDAADSIRSAILRYGRPVLAFINLQAASAGALISIACDSIYMNRGASIGAATVVDQTGKVMPDKYQSFMRGMMRSTAQATGRDPHVAESMCDTASVLTLTPGEAVAAGYCEGIHSSAEEVAAAVASGREFRIENCELDWLEKLMQILLNPILQSVFLIMIVGGIYIEIHTPGIGLPLAVAIAGAVLYFSPLYIVDMAQNWEIILFIVGIILIALEIFVIPGFGVAGISGIAAVVVALTFAMVDNDMLRLPDGSHDFMPLLRPFCIVIISLTTAVFLSVWLVHRLYGTRSFDFIALRKSLREDEGYVAVPVDGMDALAGLDVVVFADLKPCGKVIHCGRVYEAALEYGFASKGEKVRVIRNEQGRLYCRRLTD